MSDYIKRKDARNAVFGFELYTGIAERPVEYADGAVPAFIPDGVSNYYQNYNTRAPRFFQASF